MDRKGIERAAALIAAARSGGARPESLPTECSPADALEAQLIQDALVAHLGETVAGWKVGPERDGTVMRGVIVGSRVFQSPATFPASMTPLLGVEAEIAFRFDAQLGPRAERYSREEIAERVTAFAAIEVVDSRFLSYQDAPFLDRAADFMSNGAFVAGTVRDDWRSFDLSRLEAVLTVGGREIVRGIGGHASGDPILPAVALVNDLTKTGTVPKGSVMTTGTFSGLNYARPGDRVTMEFVGFGSAEVTLKA